MWEKEGLKKPKGQLWDLENAIINLAPKAEDWKAHGRLWETWRSIVDTVFSTPPPPTPTTE